MLPVFTDPKADAVYITLLNEPIGYSKELDNNRIIDYTLNPGKPAGIDLQAVSAGVNLTGLPEVEELETTLKCLGISVYRS